MKQSITRSVIAIVMLLPAVSLGSPNLSGQYWFGSLSVDVDTNAPWGKRGTVSITGDQWYQEWDDYDGPHTFSSAFTTTTQPDGSINIDFPGETYNVAWNGDVMIHANNDPDLNNRRGIDLIVRKASGLVHDDIVGEYGFFGHWLGWNSRWDEAGWGNVFFNGDGTGSENITFDDGSNLSGSFDWMLDPTDPMIIVPGRQPAMVGKGGVMFVTDPVPNNNFGLSFMVRKTDQTVTPAEMAGTYLVRFLETGPGGVPYTCGQGTCILEADGSFSMDAYYSDGEHSVSSANYTVGPGNAIQISGGGNVSEGIISPDKNLIFFPEYRYKDPPVREDYDWLGGLFGIRVPNNIADLNGDGVVDYDDLDILANQWLQAPGNPSADIAPPPNGDGIVNIEDLALFAQHWIEDT